MGSLPDGERASERSGSGINSHLPPQEIETLKKGSGLRGKDEFICKHAEGKMLWGYLNGDVQ